MKFEKLRPGMTVYDVHTYRVGNTSMRAVGVWEVRIVSVDAESRRFVASWNGNAAKVFFARDATKWREKEPLIIRGSFGAARLATREEIKAAKSAASIATNQDAS